MSWEEWVVQLYPKRAKPYPQELANSHSKTSQRKVFCKSTTDCKVIKLRAIGKVLTMLQSEFKRNVIHLSKHGIA